MKTLAWTRSVEEGLVRYDSVGGRFTIRQKRVYAASPIGLKKTIEWVFYDRRDNTLIDVDNPRHGKEQAQLDLGRGLRSVV